MGTGGRLSKWKGKWEPRRREKEDQNVFKKWQLTLVGTQSVHLNYWEVSLKSDTKAQVFYLIDDMEPLKVSEQGNASIRGIL